MGQLSHAVRRRVSEIGLAPAMKPELGPPAIGDHDCRVTRRNVEITLASPTRTTSDRPWRAATWPRRPSMKKGRRA